mgnify:CR=1 FL=1
MGNFVKLKYIAMTLRELKNEILLALYERYKDGKTSHIEFDKLCSSYSITYDSDKQIIIYAESYLEAKEEGEKAYEVLETHKGKDLEYN